MTRPLSFILQVCLLTFVPFSRFCGSTEPGGGRSTRTKMSNFFTRFFPGASLVGWGCRTGCRQANRSSLFLSSYYLVRRRQGRPQAVQSSGSACCGESSSRTEVPAPFDGDCLLTSLLTRVLPTPRCTGRLRTSHGSNHLGCNASPVQIRPARDVKIAPEAKFRTDASPSGGSFSGCECATTRSRAE